MKVIKRFRTVWTTKVRTLAGGVRMYSVAVTAMTCTMWKRPIGGKTCRCKMEVRIAQLHKERAAIIQQGFSEQIMSCSCYRGLFPLLLPLMPLCCLFQSARFRVDPNSEKAPGPGWYDEPNTLIKKTFNITIGDSWS